MRPGLTPQKNERLGRSDFARGLFFVAFPRSPQVLFALNVKDTIRCLWVSAKTVEIQGLAKTTIFLFFDAWKATTSPTVVVLNSSHFIRRGEGGVDWHRGGCMMAVDQPENRRLDVWELNGHFWSRVWWRISDGFTFIFIIRPDRMKSKELWIYFCQNRGGLFSRLRRYFHTSSVPCCEPQTCSSEQKAQPFSGVRVCEDLE